jgi:hypothetical protein
MSQQRKLLKAEYKSRRSNLYELQVKSMISQILDVANEIVGFSGVFESELKRLPKKSYADPSMFYKAEVNEETNVCEIWHLNSHGDKDRLVANVQSVHVSEEEYSKHRPGFFFD